MLLPLLGALVFLLGVYGAWRLLRVGLARSSESAWPVYARPLLNERESILYWRLVGAFPDCVVLCQVSLSQMLGVRRVSRGQSIRNRFKQLTVDYVLCDRSFKPKLVIELDGASHDHPRAAERDARKSAALRYADIPLWRLNTASLPDEFTLRKRFAELTPGSARLDAKAFRVLS